MSTTKSELIDHVAETLQLPRARAEQIVEVVFESMVEALRAGQGIEVRGFGSFTVRDYKGYEGRNPRTGELVKVERKRLPFFKVGKELRERINESRHHTVVDGVPAKNVSLGLASGVDDEDDDEGDDDAVE